MGFFKSISTGWRFIKQAFAMAKENRALLKPSIYLVVVSILYFIAFVAVLLAIDIDWEENAALGSIICAGGTLGSFIIFYFFCGMTVNMVDVHIEGGEPSMKEAYLDARQNFFAILWMAIISTFVNLLANAIRSDDSLIGNIVASIIESIWTILTFLMLPAIIIEDCSMREALTKVREMHKGNMLLIGIGEIGVRAVTNFIGFFVILLIVGVAYVSIVNIEGSAGIIIAITVGGTILALFAAFSTYVRMAYYTCMYLWAKDVQTNGQTAAAPLPLARALKM